MGVQIRLVMYAADAAQAETGARAAFERVAELDSILSDYRVDSELNQLAKDAVGTPKKLSDPLWTVLERAQDVARRSSGAFDVTCGPVVRLWREARKMKTLPSASALAAALSRSGWEKMTLDPAARTATLAQPNMQLDLGGIAKGFAGDEAIRVLREKGIDRALFEGGGDLVASKSPPGLPGWKVVIRGLPGRSFWLANGAMSTSGDAEQFVEIGGKRYSHIVDPRTGVGLTNRKQATVFAKDGLTSDSLSTTLCVMPENKGLQLADAFRAAVVFVREGGR